ncbi:hypothetical protein Gohar_013767 [Gossypium harknessii]|uniref:DUF4283 domain-containing protein n=1 Tax=Gossypium harknessii TaxID=34285 RepID=A0A7J9H157_9ROSI|nr:hypothetical protein [Gossypium harknessii]
MFHRLLKRKDPLQLPLFNADFWVQIHDLPHGLMSKVMITQFGNFIDSFMVYDAKPVAKGVNKYMWIWVKLDI